VRIRVTMPTIIDQAGRPFNVDEADGVNGRHRLRQFTQETLAPLVALNRDLVTEALARPELPRLTIDVDGSVIRTGATVGWAFRGFNPHHRKDPSYDPLVAHVAQTGHILRLKNRPGNVHDSKQAIPFLRDLIDDLSR
jgi:Transposase DDE domain